MAGTLLVFFDPFRKGVFWVQEAHRIWGYILAVLYAVARATSLEEARREWSGLEFLTLLLLLASVVVTRFVRHILTLWPAVEEYMPRIDTIAWFLEMCLVMQLLTERFLRVLLFPGGLTPVVTLLWCLLVLVPFHLFLPTLTTTPVLPLPHLARAARMLREDPGGRTEGALAVVDRVLRGPASEVRYVLSFDAASETLWVVYPPLSSPSGWMVGLDIASMPLQSSTVPHTTPMTVHKGLYRLHLALESHLQRDVVEALQRHRPKNVVCTGFGVSGAVATFGALSITSACKEAAVTPCAVTFGAPALGDPVFVAHLRLWLPQMVRVFNPYDPRVSFSATHLRHTHGAFPVGTWSSTSSGPLPVGHTLAAYEAALDKDLQRRTSSYVIPVLLVCVLLLIVWTLLLLYRMFRRHRSPTTLVNPTRRPRELA